MSYRTKKWRALDAWVYVKGDASPRVITATTAQMRVAWAHLPGVRVRTFTRQVRAGGAVIPVVAIVAQAPVVAAEVPEDGGR